MSFDDEDAPPPLSNLAEQVAALRVRQEGAQPEASISHIAVDGDAEGLPTASTVILSSSQQRAQTTALAGPKLKKGFFDAPRAKPQPKPKAPTITSLEDNDVEEIIPMIRANKDGLRGGSSIPQMFRIEPDEQDKLRAKMKSDLIEKLKPTPDLMSQIQGNASLLAAFEDPEVMAAVNDVAQNPQNFKKYQNNPKVTAFYAAMGNMMGDRLEKEGNMPAPPPR